MHLPHSSREKVPDEIIQSAYRNLLEGFKTLSAVSQEVEGFIHDRSKIVLYEPKETIVDYGEVCNYVLFPVRGLVKSTFIMEGEEKIVWFMTGGDTIIAVHSWFHQEPSEEKLTAIKETIAIAISWTDIEILKKEHPDFMALYCKLLEIHLELSIQRTKWQQLTTDGKIANMEKLYPRLMRDVPSVYLASFLGISRETFIRKRPRKGRS